MVLAMSGSYSEKSMTSAGSRPRNAMSTIHHTAPPITTRGMDMWFPELREVCRFLERRIYVFNDTDRYRS